MSKDELTVGAIVTFVGDNGVEHDAEVVSVSCPACGESFTGSKRGAGGFVAGHQAYHEFINAQDILVTMMGGE